MPRGRKRGDTYRKFMQKEVLRERVPGWTISTPVLKCVTDTANAVNMCESRLVEVALKHFFNSPEQKISDPEKIFSKT